MKQIIAEIERRESIIISSRSDISIPERSIIIRRIEIERLDFDIYICILAKQKFKSCGVVFDTSNLDWTCIPFISLVITYFPVIEEIRARFFTDR